MSANPPFSTAAWDLRSLDALKLKAANNGPQALKAAAQQMEGLFVQMMLKSMRDASIKDDALHSPATDMYTSMHDQQLAQDIAQKPARFCRDDRAADGWRKRVAGCEHCRTCCRILVVVSRWFTSIIA